jgi:hypothetical protein
MALDEAAALREAHEAQLHAALSDAAKRALDVEQRAAHQVRG